jgi:hypothetical protein
MPSPQNWAIFGAILQYLIHHPADQRGVIDNPILNTDADFSPLHEPEDQDVQGDEWPDDQALILSLSVIYACVCHTC